MAFKILTENSVDNTNIDGARAEHFNAGLRDGIVKGAFNEGIFSALASNVISFDTCELRISGHRVINDEIWTQTFSSSPSVATRYALVGQIVVDSSSNVDFSLFVQNAATQLVKDNLFRTENGAGTYQVEIGRFTLTTLGTITDIVRTLDTITGGSSGKGEHFVSGNMTTVMLESGMQANVIAEDQYNTNGEYEQTNMTWELPETAGTVVKVNNVEQANLDFISDPQTQLNNKVEKETGKGLSTNDYTTAEKTKLGGIEAEANKTIVDSALSSTSENPVQNKVIAGALDNVYTKTETDNLLSNKVNLSDINSLNWQYATRNDTYLNGGSCRYFQFGNIVVVSLSDITFKSVALTDYNQTLFSNLPVAKSQVIVTLASNEVNTRNIRVAIQANTGSILSYYNYFTPDTIPIYNEMMIYLV